MQSDNITVTALILAGSRPGKDPVAEYTGVACKVLAKVGGERMIDRVLRATQGAETVGPRMLCGPSWEIVREDPGLHSQIEAGEIGWEEPEDGTSASVQKIIEVYPQNLPLIVTTGNNTLLT